MEATSSSVALVLVSHDGARWLPQVIESIQAQTRQPNQLIAVDTGSVDGSADLLRDAFGQIHVIGAGQAFPAAIDEAVSHLDPAIEWLWILHDDSAPAPSALETLMYAAEEFPDTTIFGPKLREWPSLQRLLEVGVTITPTGRRETHLERGEYDQGQHDEIAEVLAVNTAGMLIRVDVLARLKGFDPNLPVFGADVDLGWRAARMGFVTRVVPPAVVFHAEAAARGDRRQGGGSSHPHFHERRAMLHVLLANARPWNLLLLTLRLLVGSVLRSTGYLFTRQVSRAVDEFAALFSVYIRPGQIAKARRDRRGIDAVPASRVRRLLAPWWTPYRRGLDTVSDAASALTLGASDLAERRRAAQLEADLGSQVSQPRRPESLDDDDEMLREDGFMVRFFTSPRLVATAVVVIGLLVATRAAWSPVAGGALAPAPEGVSAWWGLLINSEHAVGAGSEAPAQPYLWPLTALATLLGGQPGLAVSVVLILGPILALIGAWRFGALAVALVPTLVPALSSARDATRVAPSGIAQPARVRRATTWLLLWAATLWALVPFVTGAFATGHLSVVVVVAVAPWLAHAALNLADPAADRRWRAAWRTGLALTIVVAFSPLLWWTALVIAALAATVLVLRSRIAAATDPTHSTPALALKTLAPGVVVLGVPLGLLIAWWLPALFIAPRGLFLEAGRLPGALVEGLGLVTGRLSQGGAPEWVAVVVIGLAVAALLPRRTRGAGLACWAVATAATVVAVIASAITIDLGSWQVSAGLSGQLVIIQGALVAAALVAAHHLVLLLLSSHRDQRAGGGTRVVGAVALLAALATPVVASALWLATASSTTLDPAQDALTNAIPKYMVAESAADPDRGIVVLSGDIETGLSFDISRGDGITLGEDELSALSPPPAELRALIADLVSDSAADAAGLADYGVAYLVAAAPVDATISARIDGATGLAQASTASRQTRAWKVIDADQIEATQAPREATSWWRVLLVVSQGGALIAVLVLAAPTVRTRQPSSHSSKGARRAHV